MTAIVIIINDHRRRVPTLATGTLAPMTPSTAIMETGYSIALTISPVRSATQRKMFSGRTRISAVPELTAVRGSILSP